MNLPPSRITTTLAASSLLAAGASLPAANAASYVGDEFESESAPYAQIGLGLRFRKAMAALLLFKSHRCGFAGLGDHRLEH